MPGSTTWNNRFWYVYVLESVRDGQRYVGFTMDLRRRYEEHNAGKSFATAPRRPLVLIYYEACRSRDDAKRREEYLKTTGGRRFLAKRLKSHYRNSKLY
jgi:putative endonuclease